MSFNEYPKKMSHPEYRAAVVEQLPCNCKPGVKCTCRTGLFARDWVCKSPERFPEITVMTLDQEKQYAARGYRPNNMANSSEYEQAILEMAPVTGYGFQAYPKWKYHAFEIPKIVGSAAEEAELGDDWSDAPVLATEDDVEEPEAEPYTPPAPEPVAETAAPVVAKAASPAPKPKAAAKPAPKAKAADKVDKRSKEYRAAHANA